MQDTTRLLLAVVNSYSSIAKPKSVCSNLNQSNFTHQMSKHPPFISISNLLFLIFQSDHGSPSQDGIQSRNPELVANSCGVYNSYIKTLWRVHNYIDISEFSLNCELCKHIMYICLLVFNVVLVALVLFTSALINWCFKMSEKLKTHYILFCCWKQNYNNYFHRKYKLEILKWVESKCFDHCWWYWF